MSGTRKMMRQLTCFLLLCFLLPALAAGQAGDSFEPPAAVSLSAGEKAFLRDHPVIRFGADITWDPYVRMGKDGELQGLDVDFLRLINQATGADIRLEAGKWAEMLEKAKAREIDGLACSAPLKEREPYFLFSDIYFTEFILVILPEESPLQIRTIADLSGKRVVIQRQNGAFRKLLESAGGVSILEEETEAEALKTMLEGKADASLTGASTYKSLHMFFFNSIKIGYVAMEKPLHLVYSVRKDWPELVSIINKALDAIPEERKDEVIRKWFGFSLPQGGTGEKKTYKTIIVDHYYPYSFINEQGQPDGFSVELMKAAARAMQMDLEIEAGPWKDAREKLESKKIDFLPMMAFSRGRNRNFDFSAPHTIAYDAFFTRKGSPEIKGIQDLAGKKIIVMKNDQAHDYLRSQDFISPDQLIFIDDIKDALTALDAGLGDVAIIPKLVGAVTIKRQGLANLAPDPSLVEGYTRPFSIAVAKGNQELLERLSQGIGILKETDQYQAIYDKWFSPYEKSQLSFFEILKVVGWILLALFALGALLGLWSLSLRRQVARKTSQLREEIGKHTRTEGMLRQSEERYRAVAEDMPALICRFTPEYIITFINEAYAAAFGMTHRELEGTSFLRLIPEEHKDEVKRKISLLTREMPTQYHEHPVFTPEGIRWQRWTNRALFSPGGRIAAYQSVGEDITERKRAEGAYSRFCSMAADLICVAELETGAFLQLNPSFERVLGYSDEELLGKLYIDFVHPEDVEATRTIIENRLKRGIEIISLENRFRCKDGSYRLLSWNAHPLPEEGKSFCIAHDITEKRKAEEEKALLDIQLRQSQKMEAIGRLAGGVAHDFNNMLGVILGHAEMALESLDEKQPLHSDLMEIQSAARRSADLTRQLLAFARKQTIAPRALNLNDTLAGMLSMLQRLIGEHIDLDWRPGAALWSVMMDPSQLDQVLANLCVNARDAIEGMGKVTIETGNATIDEDYCQKHSEFICGEFVLLAVSDNGRGMDAKTVQNLFEPFFTTKPLGEGTGLGLATTYGIIKQNKGFINVYSEPGRGTTVKIYLPRHKRGDAASPQPEASDIRRGAGETILIVEDEAAIMSMGRKMLEKLGYRVLAAGSPKEALELAKEYPSEIKLLLTDVVMPEMNGRELARRLMDQYPHVKTLYMSGYTANAIAHHGVLDEGLHFVQKPFSLRELAHGIGTALESEP